MMPLTFVVAVNRKDVFGKNFLLSPCLRELRKHQIVIQEGFTSAPMAYNSGIDKSENDLIVFSHQDVIFPTQWTSQLESAIAFLAEHDPTWGVLGCFGITPHGGGCGYIYSGGQGLIGTPLTQPREVRTLDEVVLILRKSSGLRFNERLTHFHLYGADICLAASKKGLKSYAIPAFCIHNTQRNYVLPQEFYRSYWELKQLWRGSLPIQTTCIRITRFDIPLYMRRLKELYQRYFRRRVIGSARLEDGQTLLSEFETMTHTVSQTAVGRDGCTCP